jgi:hypothetical protein
MFEAVSPLMATATTVFTWVPTSSDIATGVVAYVLFVIGLWPVLVKSGRRGWGAIIPIYNSVLMEELAGYSGWLTILFYIPVVNIVMGILVALGNGRAFGKGPGFSFWLLGVLPIIGYLILGYGKAQYVGDGGRSDRRHGRSQAPA